MEIISAIAGAIVGSAVTVYVMLEPKPLPLPPKAGFIVCTRKDGSQHYRKLRNRSATQPDAVQ